MFAEIVNTYGVEILGTILVALAGVVAMFLKRLATRYINTDAKAKLAKSTVLFVEQVFKDLHGEEKLQAALGRLEDILLDQGIDFTVQELETLLEAAVAEFNDVFNTAPIMEGIDVESLSDAQLRSVLEQMGATVADDCTRADMLAAFDNLATLQE